MGEDTKYCGNWEDSEMNNSSPNSSGETDQKDVADNNFTIHSIHCNRNISICAMCQESVPKTQYQSHVQEYHKEIPCGKCGEMVTASDVFTHEKEKCPKRLVTCPFCELEVVATEASAHDEYCGARTDNCKGCNKFVMAKNLQFHYENDHKFLTPEEKESAENDSDEEGPECPICLGPITHPLTLECGHVFCMVCVKGIANNNKNCAICRRDIPRDMLMDIRFCREEDIIKNYVNKPKDKKVTRSHSVPSRRNSEYGIPTARQRLMRTTEDYDRMVSSLISSRTTTPTTRYERPSNTHTPPTYTPYTGSSSGSSSTTSSTSCADAFKDDDCCCSPSSSVSSSTPSSSTTPSITTTASTPAYSNRSTTAPISSCRSTSPTPLSPAPIVPPRAHHVSRSLSAGPITSSSNTYTSSTTPSRSVTSTTSSTSSRTTTVPSEPTSSTGTSSTSLYPTLSSKTDSNLPSPSYSRYLSRRSSDSYTSSTLYSSTSNTATSMTPSTSGSTRTSIETSSTRPRRPTTLDLNPDIRENSEDISRNPPENATQEEYDRWLAFQLATTSDDVSASDFNKKHERNEESRPGFRRSISMPDRPDEDTSSSDSDSDTNGRSGRRPPTSPRAATSASSYNASRGSSLSKSSSDSNASNSSQSSSTGARPKSATTLKKRVSFKEDEPPVRRVAPVLLPCEFCDEMFPERDLMRHQTSCDQNETSLPRLSRFSNVRSASIDALSPLPGTSGSRSGTPTSRPGTPTSRSGTPTSRSGSDSSIPDTPHSTSVSPSRNVTSPTQALSPRSITSPTQTTSRSSSSPTATRSVTSPSSIETRSITSPTPLSPTESSKPPRPPAPPTKTDVKPSTPSALLKSQAHAAPRKSPLPPPPSTPPVLPTTIVTVKDATPNSSRPSSTSPALNTSSSGSTISSLASGASSCTTPSTSSSTSPTPVDTPTEDEEDSPFYKPRRGRLLSSAIFSWRNMGGPRSASEARNKYARSNTAPMEDTDIDHDVPGILTSRSATQLPVQTDSPVPVDSLKSDNTEQDSNESFFVKRSNKYHAPAPPQLIDYTQSCPVTPLPHFSPVLPRKEFSDVTEECPSPVNTLISDYSPKAMRKSFNEQVRENFMRMNSKPGMKNEKSKKKEEIKKKEEEKDKSREEEITCEFCKQIFSPENFRSHKTMCEKVHESEPLQTPTPTPETNMHSSRSERDSKSPMPVRHTKGPAPQPPTTEFEKKTNEDNIRRRYERAKSLFNDQSVGSFSEGVTRGRNIERRSSVKEPKSLLRDSKNTDRSWGSTTNFESSPQHSNNFESSPSLASSSTKYGGSVQNLSSYQPSNYSTGHGWSSHVSMVRDDVRNRSALNNSSNYNDHGGDDDSTNTNSLYNSEVDYDSRGSCRSRSQSVNRFNNNNINNNNNDQSGHSFFHEMRAALTKSSLGHLTSENNGMRYRERSCSRQRPNSMFATSSRYGSNPHLSMYDSLSSPSRSNFSITDAFSNASMNYKGWARSKQPMPLHP